MPSWIARSTSSRAASASASPSASSLCKRPTCTCLTSPPRIWTSCRPARRDPLLLAQDTHAICVEHDLSVLDYLSDYICCLYGSPGLRRRHDAFSVREGINIFLAGFIPTENMRFRETSLTFKVSENAEGEKGGESGPATHEYPAMGKKQGAFELKIEAGNFSTSEIIVMLGQNGTGKTTLIKMLAGITKPDGDVEGMPEMNVSYKPQTISPKFEGTVRMLLHKKIRDDDPSAVQPGCDEAHAD